MKWAQGSQKGTGASSRLQTRRKTASLKRQDGTGRFGLAIASWPGSALPYGRYIRPLYPHWCRSSIAGSFGRRREQPDALPACGRLPFLDPPHPSCRLAMPLQLKFKTVQGKQFELSFEEDTKVRRRRSAALPPAAQTACLRRHTVDRK